MLGGEHEADTPEVTRMLSVGPDVCNQRGPAVTRTRGVEVAAPYGREGNHGICIVVNKCSNAVKLRPPLGSPERGAVAPQSGVTEGLVQGRCDADAYRRGGLPRPPGVGERKTSDARTNSARAVPAGLDALGGGRKRVHRG